MLSSTALPDTCKKATHSGEVVRGRGTGEKVGHRWGDKSAGDTSRTREGDGADEKVGAQVGRDRHR